MVCADRWMARRDRANGHFSCMILGCCHEIDENRTLVGYYAASSGNFFFNNQPDAIIIQNLFFYKTLHVSGIFPAHHQEFSTVHLTLASFMEVYDDCFQAVRILTLIGSGHHNPP